MSHQQQQQFITEELSQLQREILTKNPSDILQFCANYFNSKLQAQRSQLWDNQAKANAAGIDLFPPVSNLNVNASGIGFLHDRQPSFKSPFGVNDPHSNHDEDPHSAPAQNNEKAEPSGSIFKTNFDGKASSSSRIQKDVDPSSVEPSSQQPAASLPGFLKQANKIPIAFNANRRTSVSAEALNPAKLKSESWKPPVNKLSPEEEATLAQNLKNNFLFKQLDAQSKRTVLAALSSRQFPKDSVIIKQGDEGDYFYIVEKGSVDFFVNDTKVSSSGEGSSFGELALMYNAPRAATVIAATDVTCWALDRLTFRRILLEGTFNRRLMYEDFLKGVKVLETLADHERSKLADALRTEMYHAGDKIVTEGDQGENFYLIESGNCNVYSSSGGQLAKLTKGDYFGEVALLNDLPRQATVEAIDNVIVATLGKSGFQRLLGPAVDVLKAQDPTKAHETIAAGN
ncbi:cAMP-dependent protein kinase regulatory subunit [Spathaspora sp. JA1]|nr:cAMP-dependent protein kinase regulatory subunit [Spathaspora sp. JA1]